MSAPVPDLTTWEYAICYCEHLREDHRPGCAVLGCGCGRFRLDCPATEEVWVA